MSKRLRKLVREAYAENGTEIPKDAIAAMPQITEEFSEFRELVVKLQVIGDSTPTQCKILDKVLALMHLYMLEKAEQYTPQEFRDNGIYSGLQEDELEELKEYIPEFEYVYENYPIINYKEMDKKILHYMMGSIIQKTTGENN